MGYCDDEKCSKPIFKPLNKAHGFLCSKSKHYHNWHHHPHHKKVHFGALAVYIVTILSILISNIIGPANRVEANDDMVWDLSSATDYDVSDASKIQVNAGTGVAELKQQYTQNVDWIADVNGQSWNYRKEISINYSDTVVRTDEVIIITEATTGLDSADGLFDHSLENGNDIRFTQHDKKTLLSYWIENYSTSPKKAIIFIKMPILAPGENATIFLYYGNENASAGSNITNTFSTWRASDALPSNHFRANSNATFDTPQVGQVTLDSGTDAIWYHWGDWLPGSSSGRNAVWEYRAKASGANNFEVGAYGGFEYGMNPLPSTCHQAYADCISLKIENGHYYGVTNSMSGNGYDAVELNGTPDTDWHTFKILWIDPANTYSSTLNFYASNNTTGEFDLLGTILYNEDMGPNMSIGDQAMNSWAAGYGVVDWFNGYSSDQDDLTLSITSTEGRYPTDNPYVSNKTAFDYSLLQNFIGSVAATGDGAVKFQISDDSGSTWYWYDASDQRWEAASGYAQSNTQDVVGAQISSFAVAGSANPRHFKWRAYLHSDSIVQPTLTSVTLSSTLDQTAPSNSSSVTVKDSLGGSTFSQGTWYNDSMPYISWTAPSDTGTPDTTGVAGYYVYFGTTADADPHTVAGAVYTTNTYYAPTLTSSGVYHLRIETKDNAGNIQHLAPSDPSLFQYSYDGNLPNNPLVYRSMPSTQTWYRDSGELSFTWYTSGGNQATDTGGSGLVGATAGYQYRINDGPWCGISGENYHVENGVIPFATTGYTLHAADEVDLNAGYENTFEIRVVDLAGNYSNEVDPNRTLKSVFRYNDLAPTAVTGLTVDEALKTVNSFTFSWDADSPAAPEGYPTPETYIRNYVYKVGSNGIEVTVDPDDHLVGDQIVVEGVQATQNNVETDFIVWAVNESGSPGDETSTTFRVDAPAPNAPSDVEMVDVSNRDQAKYKIAINWIEPSNKGAGFNGYRVYRSTNGVDYNPTPVAINTGENASTSFTDTNLSNTVRYYYRVTSVDNTGQESDQTDAINQETRLLYTVPTGRYTHPPTVTEDVVATPKAFSSIITWETDREGSSFVYIAPKNSLGQCDLYGVSGKGQPERSTTHSVNITGLNPSTEYCYKAMWEDSDGNQGLSPTALSFTTKERPSISDVRVDNITLDSATVKWKSKTITTVSVEYCLNSSDGMCGVIRNSSVGQDEEHVIQLSNLQHSSSYFYKIIGTDIDGNQVYSDNYQFSTLTKPLISNFRFETVADAAVSTLHLTWTTNVPTTSIVTYQGANSSASNISEPEYLNEHDMIVSGLADKTTYTLIARGVDQYGNEASSEANSFTTPDDTRPPKLGNLSVEIRASGIGSTQKAQLVVSWETDEPASSQVEFGPGISSDNYPLKSLEDSTKTKNHTVIVSELDPARLYHLRAVSTDESGNVGKSTDTTAITGKVQKSVIDLILNSLERSLNFLTKLPFLSR